MQPGNKNAQKRKIFEGAVRRAIAGDDGARLREAAETLLTLAAGGERWAVECLRDTLDGRPRQQLSLDVADSRPVADLDDATLLGVLQSDSSSRAASEEISEARSSELH
jgi:hypothetical protein